MAGCSGGMCTFSPGDTQVPINPSRPPPRQDKWDLPHCELAATPVQHHSIAFKAAAAVGRGSPTSVTGKFGNRQRERQRKNRRHYWFRLTSVIWHLPMWRTRPLHHRRRCRHRCRHKIVTLSSSFLFSPLLSPSLTSSLLSSPLSSDCRHHKCLLISDTDWKFACANTAAAGAQILILVG